MPILVGLVLTAGGTLFLIASDPAWMYAHWAGLCFIAAGIASLVIGIASLTLKQLPTIHTGTTRSCESATGVRSWWGIWAFEWVVDALFALLGLGALVTDLITGPNELPITIPAAIIGTWYAIRLLLYILGSKRREAIWITDDTLIYEHRWGITRTPLRNITDIDSSGGIVTLTTSTPPEQHLCPRLWRKRGTPPFILETSAYGHTASDIKQWLDTARGW